MSLLFGELEVSINSCEQKNTASSWKIRLPHSLTAMQVEN